MVLWYVHLAKALYNRRIYLNLTTAFELHPIERQGSLGTSYDQRKLRSACAEAQADLSLRWPHMLKLFSHGAAFAL